MSQSESRLVSIVFFLLCGGGLLWYGTEFFSQPFEPFAAILPYGFHRYDFLSVLLVPESLWELVFCGPFGWDRFAVLLATSLQLAAAFGIGSVLLRAIDKTTVDDHGLERFLFSTVLGLSAFSTSFLVLGLLGHAGNTTLVRVVTVIGCGITVWSLADHTRYIERCRQVFLPQRHREHRENTPLCELCVSVVDKKSVVDDKKNEFAVSMRTWWIQAILFVLTAGMILLVGMVPSVEYDVVSYHFQGAREIMETSRVGFSDHNVYTNMPFGSEMLVLWGMALTGNIPFGAMLGKTLLAVTSILTGLGIFAAGKRFVSPTCGYFGMMLYLTTPWVGHLAATGLMDGVLGMYLFFAVFAGMMFLNEPSPSGRFVFTVLTGLFVGSAVACKYTAVLFAAVPFTVFFILVHFQKTKKSFFNHERHEHLHENSRKGTFFDSTTETQSSQRTSFSQWYLCLFLIAMLIPSGLWFAKNAYYTGNPTYPLLCRIFGDKTGSWSSETEVRWNRVHSPQDFQPSSICHDLGRFVIASPWNSPLLIPFAIIGALYFAAVLGACLPWRRWDTRCFWILGFIAFYLLGWTFFTHRLDRFWTPLLPILALLGGTVWRVGEDVRDFRGKKNVFNAKHAMISATSFAVGYFILVMIQTAPGIGTDGAVLRSSLYSGGAWERFFNQHPQEGAILLVGEAKAFGYDMPVYYNTCFNECLLERWVKNKSPEEIRNEFSERNIRFVLVHWGEIARFRSPGNYGFTDFVTPDVFQSLLTAGILVPYSPPQFEDNTGSIQVFQVSP